MSAPDHHRSTSLGAAMQGFLLWTRDFGLSALSVALLLGVATAGWTGSFIGLHDYAVAHMQFTTDEAWLVPLAFDGAAFGLSIASARAAMYGRSALGSRILVVAFTGLSSWINWLHINDPQGRFVAALLPPAAVVLFEAVLAEMRAASERRSGRVRPRLHPLRWVVAPAGTWDIYRAWILEIPLPQALADSMESPRPGDSMESAHYRRDSTESLAAQPSPTAAAPVARPARDVRPDRPHAVTSASTTTAATPPAGVRTEASSSAGRGVLARLRGLGRNSTRVVRPDPTAGQAPDPTAHTDPASALPAAPTRPAPTRLAPTGTTGPAEPSRPAPTVPTGPIGIDQIGTVRVPERGTGIGDGASLDGVAPCATGDPTRPASTLAPGPDQPRPDESDQQRHGRGMGRDAIAAAAPSWTDGGEHPGGARPGEARVPGDSAEQDPWLDIASRWGLDRAMLQIALDADAAAVRKRNKPAGRDKILDALKGKGYAIGSTGAQNYQNAIADGRAIQDADAGAGVADTGERIDEYV